eukprot:SAG11_NODE_31233_length_293_cov_1.577320_1_plen_70_part_10
MLVAFAGTLYSGHGWVCLICILIQLEIFREMVNVRYGKGKIVPLFRTVQVGPRFARLQVSNDSRFSHLDD